MVFNRDLHKSNFLTVLRTVYSDPDLRTILGFKGGTAAMLFYELPRFSVDLDFDLLSPEKKEIVFEKVKALLEKQGVLSQAWEKQYTLFYLLHYQKGERTLKIEISKRPSRSAFEIKNYLGISMLVMKQEDITAGKLAALLTRREFASRDMFDLEFFLRNNWQINENVVKEKTGLSSLEEALAQAIKKVEIVKGEQLLQGLGELLEDNKQKSWAKGKLKDELLFRLRLYLSNITGKHENVSDETLGQTNSE